MKVISGHLPRPSLHEGNGSTTAKVTRSKSSHRRDFGLVTQLLQRTEKGMNGDPGLIRTADLRFRKPMLYPSELRGHVFRQQLAAVGVTLISPSFKC